MRKLFVIVLVLLSTITFAQSRVIVKDLGTMINSTAGTSANETGFVDLSGWSKIDSVSMAFVGKGELDVDSVDVYPAIKLPSGKFVKDVTILGTATVTLDLADGVYDIERLVTSGATIITGANLRGMNGLYYVTRGATAGNDATDPNNGWLVFQVWGTK